MEEMPWQEALKVLLRDMRENSALVYHLFESLSRERIERYVFESTDDTFYRIVQMCIRDRLPGVGVVDNPQLGLPVFHQGQGDGAVGKGVDQVGGAVYRVQNPHRFLKIPGSLRLLLPQKANAWVQLRQLFLQKGLDGGIRLRHIVGGSLLPDLGGAVPVKKPVSYTHLDVYKRQRFSNTFDRQVCGD